MASVFPARAGMSRVGDRAARGWAGFPRASGDEPALKRRKAKPPWFSPRERG